MPIVELKGYFRSGSELQQLLAYREGTRILSHFQLREEKEETSQK